MKSVKEQKAGVTIDRLSPERRSWNMSRIRGKDTSPELCIRKMLHSMGYRFRIHVKTLPGKPDIVLKKHKTVILVHGCFWHRHQGCRNCTTPTNRREWWMAKFDGNVERDKIHIRELRKQGWRTVVIWECETKSGNDLNKIAKRLKKNLTRVTRYAAK